MGLQLCLKARVLGDNMGDTRENANVFASDNLTLPQVMVSISETNEMLVCLHSGNGTGGSRRRL